MALDARQRAAVPALLARLIGLAEALPGVAHAPAGRGHHRFRVGAKPFAYLMVDHHGDGRVALACKSTHAEAAALAAEEPGRFFLPAYLGRDGWVGLLLCDPPPDGALVEALLQRAHRLATRRTTGRRRAR